MDFPLKYYPDEVRLIIQEVCGVFKFSHDYLSSAVLSVSASAIGNTYCCEVKEGWTEHNSMFIAIVGLPGVNKSAPIKWATQPIQQREKEIYSEYKRALKEMDEEQRKNPPPLIKTIMSDATPEAVVQQLNKNDRGIMIYVDELKGFFNSFQRYNKGNDEEFYLQAWSCAPAVVDRKTLPSIRVESPLVNIIGTIQPEVLNSVFDGAAENGFFDRWLLCAPKGVKKEYWSLDSLNPEVSLRYRKIINRLQDVSFRYNEYDDAESQPLKYSPEASRLIYGWQRRNTDAINAAETNVIKSVRSKMEIYIHRFATINHMLKYAVSDAFYVERTITEVSASKAILLADYFIEQAVEFRSGDNSVSDLNDKWQELYDMLPDEEVTFGYDRISAAAAMLDIPERSIKRWVNGQIGKTLIKVKHGTYSKK